MAAIGTNEFSKVPVPGEPPLLRLFGFPFAGGTSSTYRDWSHFLLPRIDLQAVELPGRLRRFHEPLVTRLSSLAPKLVEEMKLQLDLPFALFGHSMGALIAFEVARQLRRGNYAVPVHLFVSGHQAPQLLHPRSTLHQMPQALFRNLVNPLLPAEVRANQELSAVVLPMLRADLAICETYTYSGEFPLKFSISAFAGSEDHAISKEGLCAWAHQTTNKFRVQIFEGGHLYLDAQRAALISAINADLEMYVSGSTR